MAAETAASEPEPEPEPQKSELCLELERIANSLDDVISPVAPGYAQPDKYAVLFTSDGTLVEKDRKVCGVFSTFGTNKDLLSFLFGKGNINQYKIHALVYPNWVQLAKVGEFVKNKIFRVDNIETQEFYYVVSNCVYNKDFITENIVQNQMNKRLDEYRSALTDVNVAPVDTADTVL
jgi:hypothetical protein